MSPTRRTGRPARPSPRLLYPDWPHDRSAKGAHGLVQCFVKNLAAYFESESTEQGHSYAELSRRAEVAKATTSKILHGDVWPESVTVARFEQLAGRRLWDGTITPNPDGEGC